MKNINKKVCLAGMAILMTGIAQAAVVTWGIAQNCTGDTDVSLNGDSKWAYSLGTIGTFVLNGQTFAGEGISTGNADLTLGYDRVYGELGGSTAPFTSLSPNYQRVLASAAYAGSEDGIITLNGLTMGQQYEVQIWVNDSRDRKDWNHRFSTIDGTAITIDHNVADTHGGLGQYILGTFRADATTQIFELTSSARQLNAIQLRAMRAPTTLGLIM